MVYMPSIYLIFTLISEVLTIYLMYNQTLNCESHNIDIPTTLQIYINLAIKI